MPALVAGIHVLLFCMKEDVDGRVKPGHDYWAAKAFSIAGINAVLRLVSVIGPTSL